MFTGYSALAMAEALPAAGGLVVACEIDEHAAALAQECFAASPAGDRIDVRVGPALDTLHAPGRGRARGSTWSSSTPTRPGYADYLDPLLDPGLLARGGAALRRQHADAGRAVARGRAVAQRRGHRRASTSGWPPTPASSRCVLPLRDGVTLVRRVAVSRPPRPPAAPARSARPWPRSRCSRRPCRSTWPLVGAALLRRGTAVRAGPAGHGPPYRAGQRRQDDQGAGAVPRLPRRRPPGRAGRVRALPA